MVSRLTDSLKKSSARAGEFITTENTEKPKLFIDFINGLKVAAGCSHQLAHSRVDQSPNWLAIRDNLEAIIDIGQHLPTFSGEQAFFWKSISDSLSDLSKGVIQLFESKAMPFADVEKALDYRLKNADKLSN